MNDNVLQTIRSGMDGFSKGQKRIAAFILDNYDRAAFMTAARVGETASVSESTVVRFAAQLGYDGYPAQAGHGQPHGGAHAAYLPLFPLMDDDPVLRPVAPAVQLVHLRRRDGLSVQ